MKERLINVNLTNEVQPKSVEINGVDWIGYGDGEYPVYIRKNSEGRVAEIRIVFIKENPARVPTRPDTIVSGIVCSSCSMEVPPHTVREHLDVDNPIHKCPHPSPERLQLEQ